MKKPTDDDPLIIPAVDALVIGKFQFHGVGEHDAFADLIVAEDKPGLSFSVAPDIASLMLRPRKFLCPTDLDRIDDHMKRCVDEEYIVSLCRTLADEFHEDLDEDWDQVFGYRRFNSVAVKRCILLRAGEDQDWLQKKIVWSLKEFKRRGGWAEYEAYPGGNPKGNGAGLSKGYGT